jgi:hypothetical protein
MSKSNLKAALTFVFLITLISIAFSSESKAQAVTLVSSLGGKCLDAEGGSRKGARLIGYKCTAASNQMFVFNANGTIKQGSLCVDVRGGAGRDGDELILWDCNGQANQRWTLRSDGSIVGINGKCLDLKGGSSPQWWIMNQPAIIWGCNNQNNQKWGKGYVVKASQLTSVTAPRIQSGQRQNLDILRLNDADRQYLTNASANSRLLIDQKLISAGGLGFRLIGLDGATFIVVGN